MTKKLTLLLAAIAVVAFAVPGLAQAAPELTIGGKKATAGQTVTGTSTNFTTQTSLGNLTCTSIATHGVVTANTGGTVQVTNDTTSGNTKGTDCTVGGKTFAVENLTLTELHTTKVGSLTFSADFTSQIGALHCKFSILGSTATYASGASPLVITLTNANFVGSPAACEPATVNGTFTVTSPSGVVVLH